MKMMKGGLLAATIMTASLAPVPADAATFLFAFSGAPLGNSATATGSFDIADSALATINAGTLPTFGTVSNLKMTVSGAVVGNGVFTTGNFATFLFQTPSALDFTHQLVGQALSNGRSFGQLGQSGLAGEFNFFGGPLVPTGTSSFTLGAYSGLSNRMALTSLIAATAVPEPASWAMMILGIGIVGVALRRYRRRTTRVSFGV